MAVNGRRSAVLSRYVLVVFSLAALSACDDGDAVIDGGNDASSSIGNELYRVDEAIESCQSQWFWYRDLAVAAQQVSQGGGTCDAETVSFVRCYAEELSIDCNAVAVDQACAGPFDSFRACLFIYCECDENSGNCTTEKQGCVAYRDSAGWRP